MAKKRKKNLWDIIDSFFEDDLFGLDFGNMDIGEGAYGHSIEIIYSGDRPIIKVETYGNADKEALIRELRDKYPNAQIIVNGNPVDDIGPNEIRPIKEDEERSDKLGDSGKVIYKFDEKGNLVKISGAKTKEGKGKGKSIFDMLLKDKKAKIERID